MPKKPPFKPRKKTFKPGKPGKGKSKPRFAAKAGKSRSGPGQRPGRRPPPRKPAPSPAPLAPLGPDTARPLALAAVEGALDKKAENPILLDVRRISSYADYVLLLSADNERQLDAVARGVEERVKAQGGRLRSLESAGEFNWLLMDFGDLVVHIFFNDARHFYDLEGLWSDAPRIPLGPLAARAGA